MQDDARNFCHSIQRVGNVSAVSKHNKIKLNQEIQPTRQKAAETEATVHSCSPELDGRRLEKPDESRLLLSGQNLV